MEYFTPEQIAKRFQVKPRTVWEWIRNGKLHALDTGVYRISEDDLKRFEEENRK